MPAKDANIASLIRYRRGVVTVLDRRGLRQRSCKCYGTSKREFERSLGDPARSCGEGAEEPTP